MKGKLKIPVVRKILWALTGLVAAAVAGFVFSEQELYQDLCFTGIIVLLILYAVVKLVFWRCPHCGRLLGGLRLHSKFCYYCEEKIED